MTCWERKSHLCKALVPTFMYGTEIWGDLKTYHWKAFEKGTKMQMMCHVRVCSLTAYHISLVEFT